MNLHHEDVWPAAGCRRLQADDAFARRIALAGQERMAQMDVDEVTHYCYQMLKAYARLQRFKPTRDPRSFEVNCEDDLVRHYDREGILRAKYLTEDNSSCLRPPPPAEQCRADQGPCSSLSLLSLRS